MLIRHYLLPPLALIALLAATGCLEEGNGVSGPDRCSAALHFLSPDEECLNVGAFDAATGDPALSAEVCDSGSFTLPAGLYRIEITDRESRIAARERMISLECASDVELQPDTVPAVERIELPRESEFEPQNLPMTTEDDLRVAVPPSVVEALHPRRRFGPDGQFDACVVQGGLHDPEEEFLHHERYTTAGVRDRIFANKGKIEEFLETHFPAQYAEAGGEAIEAIALDGTEGRNLERYVFRVKPAFRFLNDGRESAGYFSHSQFEYFSTLRDDWVNHRQIIVAPSENWSYSSVILRDYHEVGTSAYDRGTWRLSTAENFPAPPQELQIRMEPVSCFRGFMDPKYRFRLNIGGASPSFPEWREATDRLQAQCQLIHLAKALRGRYDFIRRMMMDLNGTDRLVYEALPDGSFSIQYEGSWECLGELTW